MQFLINSLSILVLLFILGCTQQSDRTPAINKESISEPTTNSEPIIGERINGPANIRNGINGEVLFSLYDSTLVTCTSQQNGWYNIGLSIDNPNLEAGSDTLRKGRKIIVSGKVVGEVLKDIWVSSSSTHKENWGELTGYTHKDNIYSSSIIENALTDYLRTAANRSIKTFQPFIDNFQLDTLNNFFPFVTFFNHENWIDDPSPLLRIQLIFDADTLIGIVHSRSLQLPNTTDYNLERGFQVAFYDDTAKETRESFIKHFNQFMRTAD